MAKGLLNITSRFASNRQRAVKQFNRDWFRGLFQVGGFTRRAMQRMVRRRKKPSKPGNPPHHHMPGSKDGLKDVLFAVDKREFAVYVGPRKFNQVSFDEDMKPQSGTVPRLLEQGGTMVVVERWVGRGEPRRTMQPDPLWWPRDLRKQGSVAVLGALQGAETARRGDSHVRRRKTKVAARPFAGPAMEKAAKSGKFPEFFGGQGGA